MFPTEEALKMVLWFECAPSKTRVLKLNDQYDRINKCDILEVIRSRGLFPLTHEGV